MEPLSAGFVLLAAAFPIDVLEQEVLALGQALLKGCLLLSVDGANDLWVPIAVDQDVVGMGQGSGQIFARFNPVQDVLVAGFDGKPSRIARGPQSPPFLLNGE